MRRDEICKIVSGLVLVFGNVGRDTLSQRKILTTRNGGGRFRFKMYIDEIARAPRASVTYLTLAKL